MIEEEKDLTEIVFIFLIIAIAIMLIMIIITANIKIKYEYEIEKMKIEQGTYERKEVKINNERNEKPDKPITLLEL